MTFLVLLIIYLTALSNFLNSIFFFFQAEDGIRDGTVTGVQTCALPIYFSCRGFTGPSGYSKPSLLLPAPSVTTTTRTWRSEERRVGKECRSRWSMDIYKK